ncbi:hypothetical protein TrRE_jg7905 [Triparma retinervis]|uniref:Methyltransferase type 11 domain-containing protein n=1 Tax=Triparma retinervis TaxID=2557542 RepID=A0A9W7DN59_9STRA|nr:hypothetical protein TrRE_jg7905 [Triparma retinervis]
MATSWRLAVAQYDFIVSTFTLCVVPSPTVALSNLTALLKPGGRILLFENSRSSNPLLASYQDATAGAASDFGGKGCVYNQDVSGNIKKSGLKVLEERKYAAGLFRSYVCDRE